MSWKNLPNLITIVRLVLVVPVVIFQMRGWYFAALLPFVVAGVSDGLDGFLAKRFNWVSRLGSLLDPLADKILLISIMSVMTWQGFIPVWLLTLIIVRDLVILTGAISYEFIFGHVEMAPSFPSKINTFCQIILVIGILASLTIWSDEKSFTRWLEYVAALTTIYSGIAYVVVWSRLAIQRMESRRER